MKRILDRLTPEALKIVEDSCAELGPSSPIKESHLELMELNTAPAEVQVGVLQRIAAGEIKGQAIVTMANNLSKRILFQDFISECDLPEPQKTTVRIFFDMCHVCEM